MVLKCSSSILWLSSSERSFCSNTDSSCSLMSTSVWLAAFSYHPPFQTYSFSSRCFHMENIPIAGLSSALQHPNCNASIFKVEFTCLFDKKWWNGRKVKWNLPNLNADICFRWWWYCCCQRLFFSFFIIMGTAWLLIIFWGFYSPHQSGDMTCTLFYGLSTEIALKGQSIKVWPSVKPQTTKLKYYFSCLIQICRPHQSARHPGNPTHILNAMWHLFVCYEPLLVFAFQENFELTANSLSFLK